MRVALALLALSSGCTAVFGLDAPRLTGDAAAGLQDDAPGDGAPPDVAIDAAPDAAPIDAPVVCPQSFVAISGSTSKYYYGSQNTTWANAEAICESVDTHLAVIGSEAERVAVQQLSSGTFYIGLTDLVTEGQYRWVTDEDTGTYPGTSRPPWANTAPLGTTQYNCVVENGTGVWSDISCANSREYLCECDGYVANPANY